MPLSPRFFRLGIPVVWLLFFLLLFLAPLPAQQTGWDEDPPMIDWVRFNGNYGQDGDWAFPPDEARQMLPALQLRNRLLHAVRRGGEAEVHRLLELPVWEGVDIDEIRGPLGCNLLQTAVLWRRPTLMRSFLEAGADPLAPSRRVRLVAGEGRTERIEGPSALMSAAALGFETLFRELFEAIPEDERAAIDPAQLEPVLRLGSPELLVWVAGRVDLAGLRFGEARHTPLQVAARAGNTALLAPLIQDHGQEVDARDVFGWTALHHAAHRGRAGAVAWLLEHGADPNAYTLDSRLRPCFTVLQAAIASNSWGIVEALLDAGGDPRLRVDELPVALSVWQVPVASPLLFRTLQARVPIDVRVGNPIRPQELDSRILPGSSRRLHFRLSLAGSEVMSHGFWCPEYGELGLSTLEHPWGSWESQNIWVRGATALAMAPLGRNNQLETRSILPETEREAWEVRVREMVAERTRQALANPAAGSAPEAEGLIDALGVLADDPEEFADTVTALLEGRVTADAEVLIPLGTRRYGTGDVIGLLKFHWPRYPGMQHRRPVFFQVEPLAAQSPELFAALGRRLLESDSWLLRQCGYSWCEGALSNSELELRELAMRYAAELASGLRPTTPLLQRRPLGGDFELSLLLGISCDLPYIDKVRHATVDTGRGDLPPACAPDEGVPADILPRLQHPDGFRTGRRLESMREEFFERPKIRQTELLFPFDIDSLAAAYYSTWYLAEHAGEVVGYGIQPSKQAELQALAEQGPLRPLSGEVLQPFDWDMAGEIVELGEDLHSAVDLIPYGEEVAILRRLKRSREGDGDRWRAWIGNPRTGEMRDLPLPEDPDEERNWYHALVGDPEGFLHWVCYEGRLHPDPDEEGPAVWIWRWDDQESRWGEPWETNLPTGFGVWRKDNFNGISLDVTLYLQDRSQFFWNSFDGSLFLLCWSGPIDHPNPDPETLKRYYAGLVRFYPVKEEVEIVFGNPDGDGPVFPEMRLPDGSNDYTAGQTSWLARSAEHLVFYAMDPADHGIRTFLYDPVNGTMERQEHGGLDAATVRPPQRHPDEILLRSWFPDSAAYIPRRQGAQALLVLEHGGEMVETGLRLGEVDRSPYGRRSSSGLQDRTTFPQYKVTGLGAYAGDSGCFLVVDDVALYYISEEQLRAPFE